MKTLKRWRPVIATAALLLSSGAWAASVQPTTVLGANFTDCSQLGVPGLVGGSSGSTPTDPQTYDLGNGQSITFDFNPDGQTNYVDFSATVPMDYVIIKAGNSYNIFHYDPALMADTHLYGPDNGSGNPAGVSHVAYCFQPKPTGSKTADATWKRFTDWTIEKTVTPGSITMLDGDSHEVEYTVTASPTTRGAYRVSGTITVRDPYNAGWSAAAVVDTMQFTGNATQFSLAWDGAGGNADTMACSDPDSGDVILVCSYEFNLQSTTHPFLLTATGGVNAAGITAKNGAQTYTFTTTKAFSVPSTPAASYGDTFSVNDSMLPGNPDHVFSLGGSYSWTYPKTFTCGADQGKHDNTATGSWSTGPSTNGTASDSASVTVYCKNVTVTKTATTHYARDYAWDPEKWIVVSDADMRLVSRDDCLADPIASGPYAGSFLCNDAVIRLNPGDSYETVYKLAATQSSDDHGFSVTGAITVSWPAGVTPDFTGGPVDTLHFTDATGGTQAVAPSCDPQGATSLACTYDAPLPRDFVTGYNQASITRNKKCYAADGTASNCGTMTYDSNQAALSYGVADVENNKCVDITDLFNGDPALNTGVSFSWLVAGMQCGSFSQFVTGDINPDPSVENSLDILADWIPAANAGEGKSCQFYVPNVLMLSGNGTDEAMVNVQVTELCDVAGCTYTQGYWKTHVNYAPKPQFAKKRDAAWDLIDGAGTANEDAIFFLSGQSYVSVMWTPPKGNAYYNLAHQYIAAKLNVLDGASASTVASIIAQAEGWFSTYPPSHSFWKKNRDVVLYAGYLASYNEGTTGPGHCSVSPATLKAAAQ